MSKPPPSEDLLVFVGTAGGDGGYVEDCIAICPFCQGLIDWVDWGDYSSPRVFCFCEYCDVGFFLCMPSDAPTIGVSAQTCSEPTGLAEVQDFLKAHQPEAGHQAATPAAATAATASAAQAQMTAAKRIPAPDASCITSSSWFRARVMLISEELRDPEAHYAPPQVVHDPPVTGITSELSDYYRDFHGRCPHCDTNDMLISYGAD
eukprot:m.492870 g.492870  ORF g.492870 m.492870 type:complete len:205 (-) comp34498_c0_seq1:55-669(-)